MPLEHLLFDAITLERGEVIDEQDTLQMVQLVLNAVCQQAVGFQLIGLAVAILRLEMHPQGARHFGVVFRDRQAAGSRSSPNNFRVDQRQRLVFFFADIHHDHATMHVDLGGGKTDARGVIHGFKHVIDQATHVVIDLGDRLGKGAQTFIGVFENSQ